MSRIPVYYDETWYVPLACAFCLMMPLVCSIVLHMNYLVVVLPNGSVLFSGPDLRK